MAAVSSVVPSALMPKLDRSNPAPAGGLAAAVPCASAISATASDPLNAPTYVLRVMMFGLPRETGQPETGLRLPQSDFDGLEFQPQSHGNGPVATLGKDLPESGRRNAGGGRTHVGVVHDVVEVGRSEEHTSELTSRTY